MGVIIRYLLMVTISICLALVESTYSGVATFYSPYVREYIYMQQF